ncbi:MAG: ATP phosphoribosyltransferase regulatory subunit [Alphaproteobacteria bacterium]|nr:ATP phosphoribosyltransferase regulatory subunit [Alphaproteobacteria bacterium]
MPAFPTTGPEEIAALDKQAEAILGVFKARGYTRHEPAILQPAQMFVDRSGEEIRRRTFEVTDPSGRELCLRPDLTIPTCQWQVESGNPYPARLCYHGLAFRHRPGDGPTQFTQAGAELLGLEDRAAGDAEMLALSVEALRAAGLARFDMKIGDLGLFSTLVDALAVPAQWRGRLKRHFWRAGYFEVLLSRMVAGATSDAERAIDALHGLDGAELHRAVEALLDKEGDTPLGARTREEIVERLMVQAADGAAPRLDAAVAEIITRVLAVSGPAPAALEQIRTLTKSVAAKMERPLLAMQARLGALAALGVDPKSVRFAAHFGRNLEYYTGFVFEFWSRAAGAPIEIAGGGRYDTLMESLGAPHGTAAIGIAIRSERLLTARRGGK